jgi:hypothetical protein
MLETVKTALRISNTRYDTEIIGLIDACKIDLGLAGVGKTDETDALIVRAVILYCKASFGYDNPESEKFQKSYDLLKCSLSLAGDYSEETTDG